MAVVAPAFRQLGGAMAAAVGKRRRLSVTVEEHDDFFTKQGASRSLSIASSGLSASITTKPSSFRNTR
jgi:hypothetical protein